jgi:hypothetical protein
VGLDNKITASSNADCEIEWKDVLGESRVVLFQDEYCTDSSLCVASSRTGVGYLSHSTFGKQCAGDGELVC